MTKKIVIKIMMNEETKKKAMKVVFDFTGVVSAKGDKDKGQIEVEGVDVDPVKLTRRLRKKLAKRTFMDKLTLRCLWSNDEGAELVSVEEKKEEKKPEKKEEAQIYEAWPYYAPRPIERYVVTEGYPSGCFF